MIPISFTHIVTAISGLTSIITFLLLVVKPVREKILGTKTIQEGQRCLLRSDMLAAYYRHKDTGHIRQYERQNVDLEYKAYKALSGNSFIDDVYQEIRKWQVDT